MEPLAHGERPDLKISAQFYKDHVRGVMGVAKRNAREAAKFWRGDRSAFVESVLRAAEFHDLGKLDQANQEELASGYRRKALPINHVDAGVAHFLDRSHNDPLAAAIIYAHHHGLPDFPCERNKGTGKALRDNEDLKDSGATTKSHTDQKLSEYLEQHESIVEVSRNPHAIVSGRLRPLLLRIALSCLVDADHYDTSRHYGKVFPQTAPSLKPWLRLSLLNDYVHCLGTNKSDSRTIIRNQIYEACNRADPPSEFYACDSPVGTGKTTAVMAHLLHAAAAKDLRRIFVVLPFTNIIDQSVRVYRSALIRPDEHDQEVVAAQHHRAEFDDLASRHLSFLWKAPIIVTTAVQFFETLASNHPAALRKLNQLPGSAVFIDEAHAALPSHLWPQAWKWLRELASDWGCHFVLGSGSLNRFWLFPEFSEEQVSVPELIPDEIKATVVKHETNRVTYQSKSEPLDLDQLLRWLPQIPGPRLLIVNTVQSAAVIAEGIAQHFPRESVEHMSTSLCPGDRESALERVKVRLENKADDDWTLVATSCVEAGVDLSFRNGLRERCSLNSLIQVGGRINRENEYADSIVWDFQLIHAGLLKAHPAFDESTDILKELFDEGKVAAEYASEAMRREIRRTGLKAVAEEIARAEKSQKFRTVAKKFIVIDSNTVTAIVDRHLIEKLEKYESVDPALFQKFSVQIWRYREFDYELKPLTKYRDLYSWKLRYDDFLGYMAGVLDKLRHQCSGTVI